MQKYLTKKNDATIKRMTIFVKIIRIINNLRNILILSEKLEDNIF